MSARASSTSETPTSRGSWDAFARLYREHYEFVWRCALRMGVEAGDVGDVVQETFMVALRRFEDFDPELDGRASSWLYSILRNVIRNHARGERRRQARLEAFATQPRFGSRPPRGNAAASLGARLLGEFLDELDEDKRAVFVLAELEGLSGPEIAEALEINVNTAQARLRAARQAFSKRFVDAPSSRAALLRNHRVHVPAGPRRRTWAALVVAAPKLGWGTAAIGSLGLGKLIVGVGLGVGLLLGANVLVKARGEARAVVSTPSVTSSSASAASPAEGSTNVVVEPEPAISILAEPSTSAAIQPEPSKAEPRRARPRAELSQTDALRKLVEARAALLDGRADEALSLVRAQAWPASIRSDARALELGALCQSGRIEEARAPARELVLEHPEHADALARHCPID